MISCRWRQQPTVVFCRRLNIWRSDFFVPFTDLVISLALTFILFKFTGILNQATYSIKKDKGKLVYVFVHQTHTVSLGSCSSSMGWARCFDAAILTLWLLYSLRKGLLYPLIYSFSKNYVNRHSVLITYQCTLIFFPVSKNHFLYDF